MMDFDERDFGERDENERDKSPVEVILGIREELAEFQRNGGGEALLARLRETRERDLLVSMQGPDPLGIDFAIEYLEERGVIRRLDSQPPRPPTLFPADETGDVFQRRPVRGAYCPGAR